MDRTWKLTSRTYIPCLDKRNVKGSAGATRAEIERSRSPQQSDSVGSVVSVEWCTREEWLHVTWQDETLVLLWLWIYHLINTYNVNKILRSCKGYQEISPYLVAPTTNSLDTNLGSGLVAVSYWIDERVEVEGREVRVLGLDEDDGGGVVPGQVDVKRQAVVEVGEGNAVLRADRLADNDLVDVIELIPILFTAPEKERETMQQFMVFLCRM